MKKKSDKIFYLMIATSLTVVSAIVFNQLSGSNELLFASGTDPYSITFGTNKNKISTESFAAGQYWSGTGTAHTAFNNAVAFEYSGFANPSSLWQTIQSGGYFTNTDPISGMTSMTLEKNSSSAHFGVYWSETKTFDASKYVEFDTDSTLVVSTNFDDYKPNYIKVVVLSAGDSEIKNAEIEFDCKNNYPEEYVVNFEYSHSSGFYDEPFLLSFSADEYTQVYYTLDCSEPNDESLLYESPIYIDDSSSNVNNLSINEEVTPYEDAFFPTAPVDKCTIVKAVAIDERYNAKSDVVSLTYFVDFEDKDGYQGLPIVTLNLPESSLFDDTTGIYVKGDVFDNATGEYKYIEEHPANYNEKGTDWEREATFDYFDENRQHSFTQDIGVRIHGGWTRSATQKSFNLYARKQYSGSSSFDEPFFGHDKTKTFMLRNGGYRDSIVTKCRDSLIQDFSENFLFANQMNYPVSLFLNGEYWGIYLLQERFGDSYVEENYGIDKDNVVVFENDVLDEGIEEDVALYDELLDFFATADLCNEEEYESACEIIDVPAFIQYMSTEIYVANADWPNNNMRMYRSRINGEHQNEDNKWRLMLYDTDDSSNMIPNKCSPNIDSFTNEAHWSKGPLDDSCTIGLLFTKLLANSQFRSDFETEFTRIANEVFEYSLVDEYLDEKVELLKTPMLNHYSRFVNDDDSSSNETLFLDGIDSIRDFYLDRSSFIIPLMEDHIDDYS